MDITKSLQFLLVKRWAELTWTLRYFSKDMYSLQLKTFEKEKQLWNKII